MSRNSAVVPTPLKATELSVRVQAVCQDRKKVFQTCCGSSPVCDTSTFWQTSRQPVLQYLPDPNLGLSGGERKFESGAPNR